MNRSLQVLGDMYLERTGQCDTRLLTLGDGTTEIKAIVA